MFAEKSALFETKGGKKAAYRRKGEEEGT